MQSIDVDGPGRLPYTIEASFFPGAITANAASPAADTKSTTVPRCRSHNLPVQALLWSCDRTGRGDNAF